VLRRTVAGSPIVVRVPPPGTFIADWENVRKCADVDTVILAWIASHRHGAAHRGRLH
jgi:hypothetical protein